MIDPLFWLLISFFLVSISLTAVLVVLVPAVRELGRAARSVEKLCDTLNRELPPTLESIRLTSQEITGLTDDVTAGVQNASRVAKQVDTSMNRARQQAQQVQVGTRSLLAGVTAAWRTLSRPSDRPTPGSVSRHPAPPASEGARQESRSGRSPRSAQLPASRAAAVDSLLPAQETPFPAPQDTSLPAISENSRTDPLE